MPGLKCIHNRQEYYCKDCKGGGICEHSKRRQCCIDCKGVGICEHNKRKYRCLDCKGNGICEHNKQKDCCADCNGSSLCTHKRRKDKCIECEGSGICEHKKRKTECIDCGGSQICIHKRIKQTCKDCKGKCICEHDRIKSHCRDCKGGAICEHDKRRSRCKDCEGGSICEHKKERNYCYQCNGKYICKTEGCITIANRKYEGYCLRCCIHLHPNIPISKNYKTKERTIVDLIIKKFNNYSWISDKIIKDGCSKRRPDLLLDLGEQVIVVEIDENQHQDYDCSCENKRLMEISQDINHRPLVFIRFNPDEYMTKNNELYKSCWSNSKDGYIRIDKKKEKEWNERINILFEQITYWINNKTNKTVEIIQLYYDAFC
uniref:Uncharacterized protein n=1 Tax=viral metagenome TaxID=1070528 RepID=A0A6C0IAT0_9ZZZZ